MRIRIALATFALAVMAGFGAIAGNGHDVHAAQLLRGWNNISYLGASAPPSEALNAISGSYSAVYRWDPQSQTYQLFAPGAPAFVNTLSQINAGDAIWVNYTQNSGELNTGSVGGNTPASGSGKLSIAASTFLPTNDLAVYEKSFNQVHPTGTDSASQRYFAPVTLPHGVSITTMTAAFEGTGDSVKIRLDYTPLSNGDQAGSVFKLAEVLSSAGTSPQTASAFAHTVDNGANVYFLVVDLTAGPASKLRGVTISYTY
jgi:hypothetical protein